MRVRNEKGPTYRLDHVPQSVTIRPARVVVHVRIGRSRDIASRSVGNRPGFVALAVKRKGKGDEKCR
jgi:hypothetical protein